MLLPKQDEKEKDYIARFMSNKEMIAKYPEEKQRLAIAYSEYRGEHGIKDEMNFTKEDAEKIKQEHNLDFTIDEILEGLNVELEHKDLTGGDLEETAKIVIAHLKERPDYYKKLKEYVETKDNDPIKKEINFNGIKIGIEWNKNEVREYPNSPFKNVMAADYGYIKNTDSQDGEELDVYVKPESDKKTCFLITQLIDNKFDEYKYMLGFDGIEEAKEVYTNTMPFEMFGGIVEIEWGKFLKEHYKFYKNIKDFSIIYDTVSIHNKKMTIMRDGYYKYLAKEVDKNAAYPMDVVTVYRPPEEVKKAFTKFKDEYKKLPVIANHPEQDLDLKNPQSYKDGEGIKPALRLDNGRLLLDCEGSNFSGKVKEFYDKGIREISCGWHGEYEKVEDETKDYQYIQKFKDFNHIAILERGRCGDTCSIKDGDNEMRNNIKIKDTHPIGTIREWQSGKYKKTGNGEWEKVSESKENERKEYKKEENLEDINNLTEKEIKEKYEELLNKISINSNPKRAKYRKNMRKFLENSKVNNWINNNNINFEKDLGKKDSEQREREYERYKELNKEKEREKIEKEKKEYGKYYEKIKEIENEDYNGFSYTKMQKSERDLIEEEEKRNDEEDEEFDDKFLDKIYDAKKEYIEKIYNFIDDIFTDLGFSVSDYEESHQSKSIYFYISNDEKNISKEIRFSDHYTNSASADVWLYHSEHPKEMLTKIFNELGIKDNQIKDEVLDMTKEELEKLVNDKLDKKLKVIQDEENEKKEAETFLKKHEEKESKKTEKKEENTGEEEIEDAYLMGDEDEEDLEKAKGKLKKFKDCFSKMKAKKVEVKDEDVIAMYDKKIEDTKISIRDAFIENSKGTYEAVEMGILNSKDVVGKTPCEIKAMVIKKVLDKEISINDMSTVNTLFDIALKNYENPIWKNKTKINDKGLVSIDAVREKSRIELEKIARREK